MIYEPSLLAVLVFAAFVCVTLAISFRMGAKAKSSASYFAAHGQIHWFVNGVAFAGDYLSAASFLGICGMIAFHGYDGFLYSIGYLAGWIVALFVIAEPMKRLGKFTFADALNSRFQSQGIQLAVGISTLAVSLFYLIPQMVGAGALVKPLLGFSHAAGVISVGTVVILIVVTAGMVSTTWVQFLKGSLLVVFSAVLTFMILARGLTVGEGYSFANLQLSQGQSMEEGLTAAGLEKLATPDAWRERGYQWVQGDAKPLLVKEISSTDSARRVIAECQTKWDETDGTYVNGEVLGTRRQDGTVAQLHTVGQVTKLPNQVNATGGLGPLSFLRTLSDSELLLWSSEKLSDARGRDVTIYFPKLLSGDEVMRPGAKFSGIRGDKIWPKLNFVSLMLALFCGTASLPHILIRYYTVKDAAAARKSTIVGITTIGFFYILTLFLGLGAMTSGALDVTNENMAAPLLARSISEWLFAIISAIAFTTVLGTVSGLILASAGAVAHDILKGFFDWKLSDHEQVRVAKIASVAVGVVAIVLGILFERLNVNYLVGWAFSVAASANLPALVMLLFWKKTTRQGVIAAVTVGMISSLTWILLSDETFASVYGMSRPTVLESLVPFSQPGIVTIPLSFLTLIVVSLSTQPMTQQSASTLGRR